METNIPAASGTEKQWTRILEHGSFGTRTKFDVIQHRYWAGERTFLEVVEIKDPPIGKSPFVIVYYDSDDDYYKLMHWSDIARAVQATDKYASILAHIPQDFPGFIESEIFESPREPWFYK